MGWTNDQPATLVVPSGATTGSRIVLDGITGVISIYDDTNTLVATIDAGNGFDAIGPSNGSARLVNSQGTPQLLLMPPMTPGHTYTEGVIAGFSFGNQPSLQLFSSTVDGLTASKILLIGKSELGNGSINLQSDQVLILPQAGGNNGLLITASDRQIRPVINGTIEAPQAVPYVNGWADAPAPWAGLKLRRDAFRNIQMIGAAISPAVWNATVGTMPIGYRPISTQSLWAYAGAAGSVKITVDSNGVITAVGNTTGSVQWDINGVFNLDR